MQAKTIKALIEYAAAHTAKTAYVLHLDLYGDGCSETTIRLPVEGESLEEATKDACKFLCRTYMFELLPCWSVKKTAENE